MLFAFYYPAQYRGVDSNDIAEPFAMCGLLGANLGTGDSAQTVCGSFSQAGDSEGVPNYMVVGAQVDKTSTPNKNDPLRFGITNLDILASTSVDVCRQPVLTSPSPTSPPLLPPYPKSPPSPAGPPGSQTALVHKTQVEFIAAGSVSDVTPAQKATIASAFASEAVVDISAVQVSIQAASVRITVVVTSATAAASAAISNTFATTLTSSGAVTTLLRATYETLNSCTVGVVPLWPSRAQ